MQKTGHSKVSITLRSGKRSVFLFVLFLFLSPVSVFAGVVQDILCPPASSDISMVRIKYRYKSSKSVTVASNYYSIVLPETPANTYIENMLIDGVATASGVVSVANSTSIPDVVELVSCSAVNFTDLPINKVSENFLMGLAGSITAGLFVFALLKSAL